MQEVLLPSLGADMNEGTLVKWLKGEGDKIQRGDKIAEIETEKTIIEMDSYAEGFLRKKVIPEGTTVPVGSVIALVGDLDEDIPEITPAPSATPTVETSSPPSEPARETKAQATEELPTTVVTQEVPVEESDLGEDGGVTKATPMARSLARKMNVRLEQIRGSGSKGQITRDDVLQFKQNLVPPTFSLGANTRSEVVLLDKTVALSSMRQAIAKTTSKSRQEIPAFEVTSSVDMTDALVLREQLNQETDTTGVKISVNDIVLRATVLALKEYPKWNATFIQNQLRYNASINIGIAIALDAGLMVPAVIGAQSMNLFELAKSAKDIGRRVRSNELTQDELTKGTFSTSNLGMFDVTTFSAIIVPGQSGILAFGSIQPTPVARDGKVVVRQMMYVTLTADHRVGDGAEAAMLLNAFKSYIANPIRLLK